MQTRKLISPYTLLQELTELQQNKIVSNNLIFFCDKKIEIKHIDIL